MINESESRSCYLSGNSITASLVFQYGET